MRDDLFARTRLLPVGGVESPSAPCRSCLGAVWMFFVTHVDLFRHPEGFRVHLLLDTGPTDRARERRPR